MLKQVGNEYMIIPVSNCNVNFSKIFNTNEVGAFIFNNLKDHTKEEVLDLLKKEYDAPFDVLKSDLDEFINELKKRGIYSD
ncbi:MAG: PqqD family protein [Acholeplasmatales bacterium]|nr:PqqD family protein [Acholeplasmatales bacterium]